MEFSFLLASVAVSLFLPWVLSKALVKDRNNKILFVFPSTVLFLGSGYYGLANCLMVVTKCNQKQEPVDMKEINRLLDNCIFAGLIKKK